MQSIRLFDRKCNLLIESRKRKKIHIQLVKVFTFTSLLYVVFLTPFDLQVQKDLIDKIGDWEKENNTKFNVHDKPFLEFCKQQKENDLVKKKADKEKRVGVQLYILLFNLKNHFHWSENIGGHFSVILINTKISLQCI